MSADGALAQTQALGNGPLRQPVLKPQSHNSRILRIDSLSAGTLFPAVRQREQAYLRLRTVAAADRYTVTQL